MGPRFMAGLVLVGLLGMPAPAAGQWPAFEARVGMAWHGSALCHELTRTRGLSGGLEARTRGAWIASTAVDLVLDHWTMSCFDIGRPEFDYDGQLVSRFGSSWAFARAKLAVGRAVDIGGFRAALTVGGGLFPTYTDYGREDDFSWQPWYGGTLTARIRGSNSGVQLELGRHRLPQRHYAVGSRAFVDEIYHWEHLVRLGMSFPF